MHQNNSREENRMFQDEYSIIYFHGFSKYTQGRKNRSMPRRNLKTDTNKAVNKKKIYWKLYLDNY